MKHLLFVALGGALGASFRHVTALLTVRVLGQGSPYATLIVNVAGSFLMGVLIAFLAKRSGIGPEWRFFLATGILGGFTTFSAFSLDAVSLWERGEITQAISYVAGSVIFSILALMGGLMLVRVSQ